MVPYMNRFELRVSDEWLALVDSRRGDVSRSVFVRGAVERACHPALWAPVVEPAGTGVESSVPVPSSRYVQRRVVPPFQRGGGKS